MNLKLACADFTFPLLSHDASLRLISMLEMDGVDIGLFEGRSHLWPSREFRAVESNAKQLARKLEEMNLRAADVFLQMDPDFQPYAINHPDASRRAKARDWFQRTLEYAAALGCGHVTTLPGVSFTDIEDRHASFHRACAELQWRVQQSRIFGITFGMEAHVGSLAQTPAEALELVQAVPGLTLTLDYTHFTRVGISDEQVEPLIAHASHFHVRGAKRGRLQASFTENTIDYQRVLEAIKWTGYTGWLGIEYVWIDWEHCNECDNISETIRFRDFILSWGRSNIQDKAALPTSSGFLPHESQPSHKGKK